MVACPGPPWLYSGCLWGPSTLRHLRCRQEPRFTALEKALRTAFAEARASGPLGPWQNTPASADKWAGPGAVS